VPILDNVVGDIKQVIVVRTDLDMGKGKIAAQVGHACVLGAEHVRKSHPEWWSEWWGGQEKVVVKVSGIKELQEIKRHAIDLNLPWSEVSDAGHTQLAPGTTTCISIGPAPENLIDKITGDLKLL
jgi:PTH2 family peptidyl-tRNA hydrolase